MKLSACIACLSIWLQSLGVCLRPSKKTKTRNHCSDLTSHNVVKNILHYLIVWVINNSLIYLCSSSLSFTQLLTFMTSQLNNRE